MTVRRGGGGRKKEKEEECRKEEERKPTGEIEGALTQHFLKVSLESVFVQTIFCKGSPGALALEVLWVCRKCGAL